MVTVSSSPPYDLKFHRVITATPIPPMFKQTSDRLRVLMDYSAWLNDGEVLTSVNVGITPVTAPPLLTYTGLALAELGANAVGDPASIAVYDFVGGLNRATYVLTYIANTYNAGAGTGRTRSDTVPLTLSAPVQAGYPGGYPMADPVELAALPTIWTGNGTPWNALGANGDYYFDEKPSPRRVYGPKAGGLWPADPVREMPTWYQPNMVV